MLLTVEPPKLRREPLFLGTFARLKFFGAPGIRLELVEQCGRVVEKLRDVVPDGGVQLLDLSLVLRTNAFVVGILAINV